ncbi:glycosyltransferase [Trichlorobacter sp.]|uniref:glycosyltransferase n=1 Tax=Trichlorobacter sp. TaxID=2911007 RepID=UPI002A36BC8F|nr:glycosyltransferase [Trichlorobacter sp.]MDY0384091.1 glycosyltransferase [Trichlorobacter sp.]
MASLTNLKIVLLFGNLELGGAERQGLLLARHLKEQQGAEVQVWGLGAGRGAVADQCEVWNIPWRAVTLHWGLRRRLPHLLRLWWRLRGAQPQIVLSYTKVPNLAAALLWRWCGVQLCVWNQADAGLLLPSTWLHRWAISRVKQFIANAEGGRQYLLKTFGLLPSQVRLIRNGVSLSPAVDDRPTWRQRLSVAADAVVVVMVANLSCYKDHATLLRAWQLVVSRTGRTDLLVLAGRFDDQAVPLQRQAKQLGVAGQVRFLGAVSDVSGLLAAADLCVHSSPSEGIPNAVLEAMASGLPVIGSDIPGLREAVGEAGLSLLAPVGDAEALAALLQRLMQDPAERQRQGALMRQRAEQRFALDGMCRETVDYLQAALDGAP